MCGSARKSKNAFSKTNSPHSLNKLKLEKSLCLNNIKYLQLKLNNIKYLQLKLKLIILYNTVKMAKVFRISNFRVNKSLG